MSTPGKYNITVYEGATYRQRFVWKGKSKRPVDLTGYTAMLRVRPSIDATEILLELSTVNGGIVIPNPTSGTFELVLSREAILAFAFTSGVYDLMFFAPDGTVTPRLKGKFVVEQGVTR